MRIGSSTLDITPHSTNGLRIQALCFAAIHHGHGVIRVPHTYVTPFDDATTACIRSIIHTHTLRCVIHAPIGRIIDMLPLLTQCAEFLTSLDAVDGVIICHLTQGDAREWQAMMSIPQSIRQYIAIELTTHPLADVCTHAMMYRVPIIFDWLHYHIHAPWPYDAVGDAVYACRTWERRRPLLHLSSPDTADYGTHHRHIHGRHSAYLDWVTMMHFVGQLADIIGDAFDLEIEAQAGQGAATHFLARCRQHTPPQWRHLWHISS